MGSDPKKKRRRRRKPGGKRQSSRPRTALRATQLEDQSWVLVHPRCAKERQEDMEEVQAMLDAGEFDVARDELRWLLEDCSDFVEAHKLLGEIALSEEDYRLARGHLGYAYDICIAALPGKLSGGLPAAHPANEAFFQCGKGLVFCLFQLGKQKQAQQVIRRLLELDPADPLGIADVGANPPCAGKSDDAGEEE